MAWSDAARRAATEARRLKGDTPLARGVREAKRLNRSDARKRSQKTPYGVSRSFYASELRMAREQSRGTMRPGKRRNASDRKQAKFMVSPKLNYGD